MRRKNYEKFKIIKNIFFRVTVLIFAYCFCIQSVLASTPQITTYRVNFTRYPQEKSLWCWVASAECSGKHIDPESEQTQSSVVEAIKGSIINTRGTPTEIASACMLFAFPKQIYNAFYRKYSFTVFKVEIMNDRIPIATAGYYNEDNVRASGHATPIIMT
ncbi:MAG: hypothetical protein E7508_02230 [Ruminococcus sp.]|nr:hypothetical protein [Ruminococcus sp.]